MKDNVQIKGKLSLFLQLLCLCECVCMCVMSVANLTQSSVSLGEVIKQRAESQRSTSFRIHQNTYVTVVINIIHTSYMQAHFVC